MTREEFLAELAKTPRKWRIGSRYLTQAIRNECGDCPITATLRLSRDHKFEPADFVRAGGRLGLTLEDSQLVAEAADGYYLHTQTSALRADILKACGLA